MAAVTLTLNTPQRETLPSTGDNVRRVIMPDVPHGYLRIYSTAEVKLELGDVTDDAAIGSAYETLPASQVHTRYIGRGECGVASSTSSAVVELTPLER